MSQLTFFLSTVSGEYGATERDFLLRELQSSRTTIWTQETLAPVGGTTGDTLDHFIQRADSVIHVIGPKAGAPLPAQVAEALLRRHPDLSTKAPWLSRLLGQRPLDITYTQLEAYLALLHGRPLFTFVAKACSDPKTWPSGADDGQRRHLERLRGLKIYPTEYPENSVLFMRIARETSQIFSARGLSPLRRVDISRLPTTFAKKLYGRDTEMADLNRAWDSAGDDKTNVLVLDAMGGTGKTALVNHFVHGLAREGWRGAEAVFVWSFYSQGTDDKRQASADQFFKVALDWFGHTGPMPPSPHDKGVRLAELVAAQRALVILDGLEPLQYGPSRRAGGTGDAGMTGGLKDQGMAALVKQLAASNRGLLIVTTRLKVPELKGLPAPAVVTEPLQKIPTPAGVELLRDLGVRGKADELASLVDDLAGHAIALNQIGTYLARFCEGDIRQRDTIPDLVDLGGDNERHPFRVMLAYETMFKRQIEEQVARGTKAEDTAAWKQRALLYLMGLFDRPMEKGDREALLKEPAIPGLTDGLVKLSKHELDYAIAGLRDLGLLLPKDKDAPDDLDAHPLVREYFGARLEKESAAAEAAGQPSVWKAAHGRLYDYYRFRGLPEAFREPGFYGALAFWCRQDVDAKGAVRPTLEKIASGKSEPSWRELLPHSLFVASPDQLRAAAALVDGPEWKEALEAFLPETEEAMAPLFAAIAHACAAGRHDECFAEVYWARVARGNEKFATKKLGLYGSDLAAIAHFFEAPFARPAAGLAASRQALLLGLAGFRLRALGRLDEAVEPMRASVATNANAKAPTSHTCKEAAINASNLSQLLLTIGRVRNDVATGEAGAVTMAEAAVAYADRSGDEFQQTTKLTTHADALAAAGCWRSAAARFAEAEAMQRETQPALPLLYSVSGYQWCALALAQGRAVEVADRAKWALQQYKGAGQNWLVDIGLDSLSHGRAAHLSWHNAAATVPLPNRGQGSSKTPAVGRPAASSFPLPQRGEGTGVGGNAGHPAGGQVASNSDASTPPPTPPRQGAGSGAEAARLLSDAVDRLRAAGASEFIIRGLLARAAFRRDSGDAKGAAADLAEAFEIAERGNMRFFLPACWIESARQRLHRDAPSEAALAAAAKALDNAETVVTETGLHRYDPDLALARAELELVRGNGTAAAPHIDQLVSLMREHDLWGFLPELRHLAVRFHLDELVPLLTNLTAARARFDAEADQRFAEAKKRIDGLDDDVVDAWLAVPANRAKLVDIMRHNGHDLDSLPVERQRAAAREYITKIERKHKEDGLDDASVDAWLAVPANRKKLDAMLTANGYPPSGTTPLEEQRNDARQYIVEIERKQQKKPDAPKIDPASIPDELVDQMLATPQLRATLAKALRDNGHDLDDMPPDQQRLAAREFIALIAAQGEKEKQQASTKQEGSSETPPPLPDHVVDGMLANDGIRTLLAGIYKKMEIDAPFDDIPREMHAALLAKLVADGHIKIGGAAPDEPAATDPDDATVDAWLAAPDNRARLDAALVANGYLPSASTPLAEQRRDARDYILNVERRHVQTAQPPAAPVTAPAKPVASDPPPSPPSRPSSGKGTAAASDAAPESGGILRRLFGRFMRG